jgi:plasmid stabilization system protein ParE
MAHNKKYHVITDPAARYRMEEHLEFLARVNENAANRLADTLLKDIRSLEKSPKSYRFFEKPYLPEGKYRYLISGGRYRIIYQIVDETVFVDDIQDCRQDDDKNIV